jgi:hypothetical protein
MAKGATAMADEGEVTELGTTASGAPRRRRAPQGPRRPSPIYIFVKIDGNGKPVVAQTFRDPRKMADYFNTSKEEGSELLVVTPE